MLEKFAKQIQGLVICDQITILLLLPIDNVG